MKMKKRPLLLAFCIPVAVMCIVIIYKDIYPFGEQCFLRVDMYNQYMPFFTELHRKLREGGSLFFSWRAGLGADFLALYAYYLASPVNLLLILCPEPYIIEFMTFLIVIKIGLCGSSFAWYLKKHFGAEDYIVAFFSAFYALSGYMCAYYWNIMWLDCMILAPIVILGLERLVYRKKTGLYTVVLAACILTNYYVSIPICIFLVCYFFVLCICGLEKDRLRSLGRFLFCSVLAGGMAAVLLLPTALALRAAGFSRPRFPSEIKVYFNMIEMLARHCMNVGVELRSEHWPNLYCGAGAFFLFPLYVCCKKIRWKEKLAKILLLIFLYLSFSINVLDFFWHGLNYPNSLPARQSFLAVFLLLSMCFEVFLHRKELSGKWLMLSVSGALVFLLLCSITIKNEDFSKNSFLFTALYVIVLALLFYWNMSGSLKKNLAELLFFVMIFMEITVNTIETSVATTNRAEYHEDYRTNRTLLAGVAEQNAGKGENEDEAVFYRVEEHGRMTKNDGMLAGFPSATYFSSTVNGKMGDFYEKMGMSSSKVFYCHDGASPFASALLAVDYTISDNPKEEKAFYELIGGQENKYLYQNRLALPVSFGLSEEMGEAFLNAWEKEAELPFERQNQLAKATGVEPLLFEPIETYEEDGEIIAEVAEEGYLYGYPISCSHKNITADIISRVEKEEKNFEKVYYPRLLDLGSCEKGDRIVLKRSGELRNEKAGFEAVVYRMNPQVLTEAVKRLGKMPMQILEMQDTYVCGTIEMKESGYLITSIPRENGWKLYVDGKKEEIVSFADVMLGAKLDKGNHRIELIYTPPGLYTGAVISITSVILFLLLYNRKDFYRFRRYLKKRDDKRHKAKTMVL